MHLTSVALVLVSAAGHVYWNFQLKRSPARAAFALWLTSLGAAVAMIVAFWVARPFSVPPVGWLCMAGTGFFYAGYYGFMGRSYRDDDLSRAYPVARGVGPVATAAWGILFFHEHPSLLGGLGILGITTGVLVLCGPDLWRGRNKLPVTGILAAVATGLCISGYSTVDKQGVQDVHPMLYIALTFTASALAQVCLFRPRPQAMLAEFRRPGAHLLPAAAAHMGSYLLILFLFRTEPVSYIVPLRSVSVLFSVYAGARLLGETGGSWRGWGAALICLGITVIALGG